MCGIAGLYSNDYNAKIDANILWSMIHAIVHRGPDAQQVWQGESGIGLAHARLSIIDLDSRSNQPMVDPQTGHVIIFNGEIYNYIEIKQELMGKGYFFNTMSDTEVILKAYDYWGVDCLNKFNGMWAFVIFDAKKRKLLAARDRFGIKPFVYGQDLNGDLVFASEAKAILKTFPVFKQPNMTFLSHFVEYDSFACYEETFYQGLFNLLPGHYFFINHGEKPKQIRYWNWKPEINYSLPRDEVLVERFEELITSSVQLRFRSDVSVGSCLSGGLDSTTIVGLAAKLFDKKIATFSCVYPDHLNYDESSFIDDAVKKFNTEAYYITPSHQDYIQTMYDSVFEQDGPTGGPSILSQRAVMSLAKGKVKVLLDGQGADEVLGGYHGYFPYSLLSCVRDFRRTLKLTKFLKYRSYAKEMKTRVLHELPSFKQLFAQVDAPTKYLGAKLDQTSLRYLNPFEHDDLNTLLMEHMITNLPGLLHYEDRNSMLFSIESRLPFLDYRLIEFVFTLPHWYKIRGKRTKWLLYEVAKKILPTSILERKDKMGYATPGDVWFSQEENIRYLQRYFAKNNPIFAYLNTLGKNYYQLYLEQLWADLCAKKNVSQSINPLWRFITASMWLEKLG